MISHPPLRLDHLMRLLDDTGIMQHATFAVPTRAHGYCLDDNARGLQLAMSLHRSGTCREAAERLFACTAAFVQHAMDEETGRFRNFMAYDRRWLERSGSEDSHGRAVWALGVVARDATDDDARGWAGEILVRTAPVLPRFTSPRALASGLLGLVALQAAPAAPDWSTLRAMLADRLMAHWRDESRPGWTWFERQLSYDNARMPHALIEAGVLDRRNDWLAAGLDSLRWLCAAQTGSDGQFAPVGSAGGWERCGPRAAFDQQPIEAGATVAAALAAKRVTGDTTWMTAAACAHRWFLGANTLDTALVVPATGACRDGLHPDRLNANQGAESTLAWLQADLDVAAATS